MATPENNPNDYKVVTFTNKTDFAFTPEMGCMYDGRPIFGISGASAINAGESIVLPYHVGSLLARNLAKAVMVKRAPTSDQPGIPTGVSLWDETKLENLRQSFLTELYTEHKPAVLSETDRLMAKVEELKNFVEKNISPKSDAPVATTEEVGTATVSAYADKAEVIAELTKRGIKFDARQNKANLETLLA